MESQEKTCRAWLLALALSLGAVSLFAQETGSSGSPRTQNPSETPAEPAPPTVSVAPAPPPEKLPASTADIDSGKVVYFSFETGRLEETLPFDIQFYLRIPVAENVTSLEGRYVGDARPFLCQDAFARARIYADYGFGPREPAPSGRRQEQPIGLARFFLDPDSKLDGKKGTKHAELNVVNGLLPNHYYCFEFIQIRKAVVSLKEFQEALVRGVDLALRDANSEIVNNEGLRQESYRELRAIVIAALDAQLNPGERLVLPATSFLDRTIEVRDLPAGSKRAFDAILQTQNARAAAVDALRRDASDFVVPLLQELVLSGDLEKLSNRTARRPQSRALTTLLRGSEKATFWANLCRPTEEAPRELCPEAQKVIAAAAEGAEDARTAVAEVTEAAGPSPSVGSLPPLDDVWTPGDLKSRRENIDRTLSQLRELRSLVSDLREEGLVSEAGVTDEGLSKLRSTVTEAINELDFLRGDLDLIEDRLNDRERQVNELVARVSKEEVDLILVEGSTTASFETRANWYLGMDLGFAWSPDIEDFFSYVGMNIYFRPINKKAHLSWSDFRRGQRMSELAKRLSVTVGISIRDLTRNGQFQGVELEDDLGVIANRPLIFSGGIRLNDFMRFSAGALIFKDRSPDPLLNESKLAWSPLVSLSIDWNLRGALRNRFIRPSGN